MAKGPRGRQRDSGQVSHVNRVCSQAIAAREELPPALQRLEHRAFHALVAPPHDEEVVPQQPPLVVPTIGHLAVVSNELNSLILA